MFSIEKFGFTIFQNKCQRGILTMRLIDDDAIELCYVDNPKRHRREQGWNEAMDYIKKVLEMQPTIETCTCPTCGKAIVVED